MASLLKVDALTGVTTAGSISVTGEGGSTTTNLQQGLAKAWVHTDMVGTAAILDSFNIGSLTDSGGGTFAHTFVSDMSGADKYSMAGITGATDGNGNDHCLFSRAAPATTGMSIIVTVNNSATDRPDNFIVVHGDLA